MLGACQWVELYTYLNGVSWAKWKKYTDIEGLSLTLDFKGEAEIILVGVKLEHNLPTRTVLDRCHIRSEERTQIELAYPSPDDMEGQTITGFEISSIADFELFGGFYAGTFPDESARNIELALLTTTFKREAFIRKNMLRLKEGLLDVYPEIRDHIHIHIVDNGRTLTEEDIPGDSAHFHLHPNPNVGGSGGYARGMIECLHQDPEATHGILMDDDIMILPDSIYRTFQLLRFLKPKHHTDIIGGAMLLLEDKVIQHEDSGFVGWDGYFHPVKRGFNHGILWDNLKNEEIITVKDSYQAWWYCCIPVPVMKKNGLPLPLFIRGDDVEYGLRCKEKIITMNGICLWHMGFGTKYSPSLNIYQEIRNLMIDQAVSNVVPDRDYLSRLKDIYRKCLLKHDYASCEVALRALEDYMKGPEFIMVDRGEQIMKENNALRSPMVPYDEIQLESFDKKKDPYREEKRTFFKKWLYRITWNGHILIPERWLSKKIVNIPYDNNYRPGKMAMKRTYVAMDVANEKACIWEIDRSRFKELQKRYRKDMDHYKKHKDEILALYKEKADYLKSEEFWRKYLGMN